MSNLTYHPEVDKLEHDSADVATKRVLLYGWDADNLEKVRLAVDSTGNLLTPGFSLPAYDYIGVSTTDTTEVYTYKSGGSGGTTVATVTTTYTDSTKAQIASIAKT